MDISKITLQNLKYDIDQQSEGFSLRLSLEQDVDQIINEDVKNLDSSSMKPRNEEIIKELEVQVINSETKLENENIPLQDNKYEKFSCETLKSIEKYFNIWKEKSLRKNKIAIAEDKINKFIDKLKDKQKIERPKKLLDKIELKNAKNVTRRINSSKSTNSSELFENRYKAQRDIILMQKSKLLEQEQLIQELQFGKICDELKSSFEDSQATIKKLLTKFSTRTKIVTGVKIVEEPEEIQMKINKVPKLIRQMEQRAQERELKRKIIQERKRLIDEEKKRLIEEQIENKRKQDDDEKKKNLEAIKERRRQEVEDEKRKQYERASILDKMQRAEKFYKKKLKKRGVLGFKLLMQRKENNENISLAYYEAQLVRKCLVEWKLFVKRAQEVKIEKAVKFYEDKLKRKCFRWLVIMRIKAQQNMQVAVDYHNYQIQGKIFKKFYLVVNAFRIRRYHFMRTAIKHYKARLLVQSFYQWKSLPAVLQLERAKEEKKRKWREKVLEVLPDYKPPQI